VKRLNDRIDPGALLFSHNLWKQSGRVGMGQDTAPFLVNYVGGTLGEDGLFVFNGPKLSDWDWENMFSIIMAEMDEYDELIRSRMAEIDAEEYPGALGALGALGTTVTEEGLSTEETAGAEENLAVEETAGAEENTGAEESAGAEENLDTEDASDSNPDEAGESESKAA
jgi:hypothetical protein